MYLCTYEYEGKEAVGVLSEDRLSVIPINNLVDAAIGDMNDFIDRYHDRIVSLKKKIGEYEGFLIPIEHVKIGPPIKYPKRDLLCLGKNYKAHALEIKDSIKNTKDIPEFPIYFTKRADPAIGTGDTICRHEGVTDEIDYEVELAAIIGKDGMNIAKDKVDEYIFGYTIVNDVSARDIQRKHEQWFRGKSLQTFCPMGPYIVSKDEVPFPVRLEITSRVNDEIRQASNTEHMIFDIPHIISELSQGIELKRGDIIITGTPAGVGLGFKPPKFLKSGDKVECYIENIGTLVNYIE